MTTEVTCHCGTRVDEATRIPTGPVTQRGIACLHAAVKAVRPDESKRMPGTEVK